jgi:LPS sulfotransferase NodH
MAWSIPSELLPTQAYLLCFVSRSGSNLLAWALESTGLLGKPRELFSHPEIVERARQWKAATLADYTGEVLLRGSTANGVFGVKVSADQLFWLARERIIPDVIADPAYVYVTRRDLLGQAISLTIARQTGRWSTRLQGHAEPEYDPLAIAEAAQWLVESQAQFEYFFAIHGIEPLRVSYEDLDADLEGAVTRVARGLGVEERMSVDPDASPRRRQRTRVNDEFRERLLAELAGGR